MQSLIILDCLSTNFAANNCPLQVLCLQESWFSSDTDLSPYKISGYHMISTGHYASNHGGLVIYVSEKWSYKVKIPRQNLKYGKANY